MHCQSVALLRTNLLLICAHATLHLLHPSMLTPLAVMP